MKKNSGFTIIEVFIVITLVGLLAAIAIPSFVKAKKTKDDKRNHPEWFCQNGYRLDKGLQRDMRNGSVTNQYGDIVSTEYGRFKSVIKRASDIVAENVADEITPAPTKKLSVVGPHSKPDASDTVVEVVSPPPQEIIYKGYSYILNPKYEEDDVTRILRAAESMTRD